MSLSIPTARIAGAVLFFATLPARGEPPGSGEAVSVVAAPGAALELDGDSSLHRYSAKAQGMGVDVGLDAAWVASASAAPDVEALIRGRFIRTFQLTVPVGKLSSGERGLDERMRKALKGNQYREIRFRMDSYDVAAPPASGVTLAVTLHGRLSLAGVERRIDVAAAGVWVKGGVRFTGSKDLLMTDYGVKPPTLVFGAIKTENLVTVKFDVTLQLGRKPK